MKVVDDIDQVESGVIFCEEDFARGLNYYINVLQDASTDPKQLHTLYDKILQNIQARRDKQAT